MGGRVRWQRDGETVTGFRKTDRRQSPPRALKDRLHDLALKGEQVPAHRVRLVFALPKTLEALVSNGDHAEGLEVFTKGYVRISSWSAEKCFMRAQAFFRDVARDKPGFTTSAVLIHAERPGERYSRLISVTRGAMVVTVSSLIEPQIFEAA